MGLKRKTPRGWIQIGESRTRGVARIPIGLKPSRDSRTTSQRDSPIWIQPLWVFRYTVVINDSVVFLVFQNMGMHTKVSFLWKILKNDHILWYSYSHLGVWVMATILNKEFSTAVIFGDFVLGYPSGHPNSIPENFRFFHFSGLNLNAPGLYGLWPIWIRGYFRHGFHLHSNKQVLPRHFSYHHAQYRSQRMI